MSTLTSRMGRRSLWRVTLLITVCAFLFVCAGRRDPNIAFNRAESAFEKGDTEVAAREADIGYRLFHKASKEWAWRFTILKARTLSRQGRDEDVLRLLASEPGPPPT